MTDWTLVLGWGTPIGIGIFLVCLATMVFLLSRASAGRRRDQRALSAPGQGTG